MKLCCPLKSVYFSFSFSSDYNEIQTTTSAPLKIEERDEMTKIIAYKNVMMVRIIINNNLLNSMLCYYTIL